ncbi:hypothetical protein AB9P05_12815 [Roseivirga sp. BDSF3-8]|uniref:hypothetical protein n=1 Tax=Roseivirga sp. BDSF3-8 TaxID=3241598 RepID=UPI0035324A7A
MFKAEKDGRIRCFLGLADKKCLESPHFPHTPFFHPFHTAPETDWLLEAYVLEVFRIVRREKFRASVVKSIEPFITQNFWQKVRTTYRLNHKGNKLKDRLLSELKGVSKKIEQESRSQITEEAAEVAAAIGANLVLARGSETRFMALTKGILNYIKTGYDFQSNAQKDLELRSARQVRYLYGNPDYGKRFNVISRTKDDFFGPYLDSAFYLQYDRVFSDGSLLHGGWDLGTLPPRTDKK